jgi:hypothetical protein
MILLKTLLLEAADDLKPKLSVLFVGDGEVTAPYSFARQITKTLDVKSKIVGFKNASSLQIYKLVKSMLPEQKNIPASDDDTDNPWFSPNFAEKSTPKYDIITIMAGGSDGAPGKERRAIRDLDLAFRLAKESGAKLIAISNPTKSYLETDDALYKDHGYPSNDAIGVWVNNQTISDAVIDVNSMSKNNFAQDHVQLSVNAHRDIANEWKSIISNFKLNIIPKEKKETDDANIPVVPVAVAYDGSDTGTGNFSADLVTQAYDLILKYEGFNPTAKWDKTNWRIGHGSSTITYPNGKVIKLSNNKSEVPAYTVTLEDAGRDLRRRTADEFIPKVKRSLGGDTMSAWSNGTIAALTSICYNYGSLPDSIVNAAKTKNTSTLVAAVRALETHNAGINKKRRNKEADYIAKAESVGNDFKTDIKNIKSQNYDFGSGGGQLIGAAGGGDGGDWGGSLPKLISVLPAGSWKASSQKRAKKLSKSGITSDHYMGNTDAYAGDFFVSSAFGGDEAKATAFAIAVARNAGKNIDSWDPYIGKYLNIYSGDHRIQIIWQSMVGGNHYDHVHVGVTKR